MLRNRSLAAILVAELVSLTGSAMTYVALPWFVLITTGSTARMGWVLAAELLPVGLLGIPSGSVIARIGAKGQVVIPKAIRDRANLHPGDEVDFEIRDDEIVAVARRLPARLAGRFARSGMAARLLEDRAREKR